MQTQIMGIINVTPDSFYADSRVQSVIDVVATARRMVADGADIIDLGACSTRPNSQPVDADTEWQRLQPALQALRAELPDVRLSVDTFQPLVAQRALEEAGELIINDISGGCEAMYEVVRAFRVPYIWTLRGDYSRLKHINELADLSLILDPGFGFAGGVENDYRCLKEMDSLKAYGRPILVGVSRKSMLYRLLDTTPEDCLAPTQVLHFYALQHGATILRVHDVREARQTVTLYEKIMNNNVDI